jgi:hypothetical protein
VSGPTKALRTSKETAAMIEVIQLLANSDGFTIEFRNGEIYLEPAKK